MRLYIRTEASSDIGMGHVMRCFAVAEAARQNDIPVTFLLNAISPAVMDLCQSIGAEAQAFADIGSDLPELTARLAPQDWILIDSYRAMTAYLTAFHTCCRVAVIDDLEALDRYDCDLLINPAMAAPEMSYAQKSSARLLLGPAYALIRQEFRTLPEATVTDPSICVMFGGSDPSGLTAIVARALHDALPGYQIRVIAGPANQNVSVLEALAESLLRLKLFVAPSSVAAVLAGSDLVVTAAGGTIGEVAAMGLPALVIVVYDNQKAALVACPFPVIDARRGLPDDLAQRVAALLADPPRCKAIARHAHSLVDGRGALRIVEAMLGT